MGRHRTVTAALSAATVLLGVLGTAIMAPVGGASAATGDPGLTAKSVTVGQVDTLSGPVPGLFQGAENGTRAYFAYINSKGGVNGRKLQLDVQDDAFSGANYTTETQQLVKQTFALVGGFSLFDGSGVQAVDAAKIPDVTESLSAARNLSQYNYAPDPIITGATRLGPLVYYKKKYPSAVKHVGTLYSNVATAEVQSEAVLNAMKSQGYKVSYQRIVNPVETDFTPDVLKMRSAGVQMVYIVGLAVPQVAALAQQMTQQGFKPQVFSTNGVAYDSSYVPSAGSGADGTVTDQQSSLYLGQDAKAVPAVALFDKWMKKVSPKGHVDTYAVFGWAAGQLFAQALKAAGANPTRAAVITQLNKITSFSADGLIATGNPAQKVPPTCWLLIKVQNGTWLRSGPTPKSGFVCNPGGYYYPPGHKPFVRQGTSGA